MPKKQRNAFYFFMKELQEKYNAEGKNVTMKDLPTIAHPLWKNLSDEKKIKYENMAKECKKDSTESVVGKQCSDGTLLVNNIMAEQEQQEKAEEAMKFVERFITEMDSIDEVKETCFFIMVFNVLCSIDDEIFIPLEVGITKYSIKNGIEDDFHLFIDPGPIPIGYTRIALQHSNNTHKIPIKDFPSSEHDYSKICESIRNFINPEGKEIAPVFCLETNMKQNQSCLEWLCKKAPHCRLENVQYYDLVNLLMELRAYVNHAFPCKIAAFDMLTSHAYDFTTNIRCNYHEDLDNINCALGYAKQLCFLLSDAICNFYGVDCTPNHIPPRVSDSTEFEIYQPKLPPTLPIKNIVNIPVKPSKHHIVTTIVKKSTVDNNLARDFEAGRGISVCDANKPDKMFSNNDFPSLSKSDCRNDNSEMRQPNTMPFVLSKGIYLNQDKRYAALSLGRGIGRGKPIP